jgi:AcrR family transcriptional regulator
MSTSRSPNNIDAVPRAANAAKRSYLRSEERRAQLLEVATRIAGSEGVDRLTIVGLAKAAGVSRQLVYDHFSDLRGLVGAVLAHRFTHIDNAIYESISAPGAFDSEEHAIEVALGAARGFLELSREDRHLLRSVLTTTDAPAHELNPLALALRERSIKRWRPVLGGDREPSSRARAWALANALDGLGDLVATGDLDVAAALQEFEFILRSTLAASAREGGRQGRARGPEARSRRRTAAPSRGVL